MAVGSLAARQLLQEIEIAQNELGLETIERPISRTEFYVADAAFFCGTGVQVVDVREPGEYSESLGHIAGSRLIPGARVRVLSGAGVSAESGIPTFRDAQTGLWAQYHPEDLATPEAFERNPKLVWDWYAWRRELVGRAQPNPGHLALAQIESHLTNAGTRFTLITQNVDGLHHLAAVRNAGA